MHGDATPASAVRRPRILIACTFAAVAALYAFERARNPGWGDGLGFLVAALEGFAWSVNATGHFLYGALTTLVLRAFPGGDPVSLLVMLSLACAVVALVQVFRTALLVTGDLVAALAGMLILAFSFTFWRQAVSIEVYPLQMALLTTFLRDATEDVLRGDRPHADRIGIAIGLALLVHIQTVLLLPAFAYWALAGDGVRRAAAWRSAGWIAAALIVLVVPAAILPEFTVASVFVDFQFADEVFAFDARFLAIGLIRSIGYLAYNFHVFLVPIVIGATFLRRRQRSVFVLYAAVLVPVWGFAFRYPISDNYVFFLPAYLVLALASAMGFSVLFDRHRARAWLPPIILAASIVLSPALYGAATWSAGRIALVREAFAPVRYKGGAVYYLWPGMRRTPDPLAMVRRKLREMPLGTDPAAMRDVDRRAIAYLRLTGGLPPGHR